MRRTATEPTRNGAQQRGAELLLAMGGHASSTASVGEFVAEHIAVADWSPTYRADVLAVVDQIPERFMNLVGRTVTPRDATDIYRHLAAADWSPHRIRRVHEELSAAFAHAARQGALRDNPFRHVRKPGVPARELVIPTDDEVYAILVAPDHPLERLALRLAATLGGRRGEVVALQWRDVDLERETLVIRRSLSYTPETGVVIGDTKTGETGHRVLSIDSDTAAMLADRHAVQEAQGRDKPGPPVAPRWVISSDAGVEPWRPDRLTHVFAAARKKAGVHGVRLHDLRHYVATTMLHDGEAPIDVANQLGHSDMSTTIKKYAHYLPGRGRESAVKRAARLDRR